MAGGPVGVKHPAKKLFLLTLVLNALVFLLSIIAIFVPWSWKNTAVFQRTYIGLWENCVEQTNSPTNAYLCNTNDIDQVGSVAGGSLKCRGFIAATQVFTVSTVVFSFLATVTAALILGKLWSKPVVLAGLVALFSFFTFTVCLVAFLMWIVYAETNCQPGNPLFPVRSYSWGWILMVVATLPAFLGMVLAYLGLFKVLKFKPFEPSKHEVEQGPVYEGVFPVPSPQSYPYALPAYPDLAASYPLPVVQPSVAPSFSPYPIL